MERTVREVKKFKSCVELRYNLLVRKKYDLFLGARSPPLIPLLNFYHKATQVMINSVMNAWMAAWLKFLVPLK